MATIGFYAAGAAIGVATMGTGTVLMAGFAIGSTAAVGGMIGGVVGSVVDSQFLMPALFGSSTGGARLKDLDVQTASEGSPIKKVFGPNCRVAGTIAWLPRLKEEEGSAGGKGGFGGGKGGAFTYFADTDIIVCRGPISRIKKVWADNKLIYENKGTSDEITFTSDELSLESVDNAGGIAAAIRRLIVFSPTTGPDLTTLTVGRDLEMSGWATAGNNGTFRVIRTLDRGFLGTAVELQWVGPANDEAAGATVTIEQLGPREDSMFESLTVYTGTLSQTADPTYEAAKGVGNAPAFRTWCHVAIKNLSLGNSTSVPQLQFLVEEAPVRTVGEIIASILQEAGLTSDQYDVSLCTQTVDGYVIDGPTSASQAIEPLMMAYDLSIRESNGKLVFFPRTSAPTVSININDLAAHEFGEEYTRPILLRDGPKYELPSEVNVNFIDPSVNYTKGSIPFRKTSYVKNNIVTVVLPIVLTSDQARNIAKRLLMTAWAENREARLSLPPSYAMIEEGDLIGPVPLGGQAYTIRVNDINRGINFRSEIVGTVTQVQTLTQSVPGQASGTLPDSSPYYPPVLAPIILDIPALTEAHASTPGVYFGAVALDRAASFQGSTMYWSSDDLNFTSVGNVGLETISGECLTTLGDATYGCWDYINTIDVDLRHGDLESKTELEVLNGANIAMVGSEMVGYTTATLLSPGQYRISGLLRGLRNTERFMGTHTSGESFALLSGSTLQLHTLNVSTLSTVRHWRSVASLGNVVDTSSLSTTLTAATVKPFSPCHVTISRDVSNNITVTWKRRSRAMFRLFSGSYAPMLEENERYDIVFRVGSTSVSVSVVGATSYTYTAAQQTADGFTPSATKYITLYQVSTSTGRGFPTTEFNV